MLTVVTRKIEEKSFTCSYSEKEIRCPKCNHIIKFYVKTPKYCFNAACGATLPNFEMLLDNTGDFRIQWHFR